MMYHRKRSLAGGASWGCCSPPAPPSPPLFSGAGVPFSASSAITIQSSCSMLLERAQPGVDVLDRVAEHRIHHPEKPGEGEDGDDHDCCRGLDFLPGRGDHLAHLGANVAEKIAAACKDVEGAVRNA